MKRVKRLRLTGMLRSGLVVIALVLLVWTPSVHSAVLLDRSIQVLDPKASAVTSHTFAFFVQSNNLVGSIVFEYCTNNPFFDSPCVAPVGLDVSVATLDTEVGETGFAVDGVNTTVNRLVITRPPAITNFGPAQLVFSNITNPSTPNQSVYVRISLHGSTDGSGARTDQGAVVFVVTVSLDTRAYVPPHLTFCVGITVALDCTTANGFYINLGELNKSAANTGTSQYAAATNDLTGYSVSLFGVTMTSGTKTIPALNVPTASTPGTSQFGVNLRDNAIPDVGSDPQGSGTAVPSPGYAIPNTFKFVSGDVLSSVSMPSDFNRFTMSYLVNAAPDQPPGIYNATFTFVAVASF
jgi:hypothetical protein